MKRGGSTISPPSPWVLTCPRARMVLEPRGPLSVFFLGICLVLMMAQFGCQRSYVASSPPAVAATREQVLARLAFLQGSLKGMRGMATLEVSTTDGVYRGKEFFWMELPDRFRFESLNLLGFPDWVLSSDGDAVQLYLPTERKIIQGASDPKNLERMLGAKIPISCVLRILMGLPPLPLDDGSSSWIFFEESGAFLREEETSSPLRQLLWVDGAKGTLERGDILEGGKTVLSFHCGDHRELNGFPIPFRVKIHLVRSRVNLLWVHRELQVNPSFPEETFRLALPAKGDLQLLRLEEIGAIEDWKR
ncbi:MAG: hypothetical protein QHH30_00920 [candidate division NC10 bacterium]|nr:hypothetical protein [candidate division NC10 bacterium]